MQIQRGPFGIIFGNYKILNVFSYREVFPMGIFKFGLDACGIQRKAISIDDT